MSLELILDSYIKVMYKITGIFCLIAARGKRYDNKLVAFFFKFVSEASSHFINTGLIDVHIDCIIKIVNGQRTGPVVSVLCENPNPNLCRKSLPLINASRQSFSLFNPGERLKSFAQAPFLLLFLAFISFGISVCV